MEYSQVRKVVALACLVVLIASCGGGGGSDSPNPPPTPQPPPANTAPVLNLSQTELTMNEGSSITTTFTVSDAQNDQITVSVESSDLTVSESNGTISINAPSVESNQTFTITVTATDDNQASSTASITVNVENISEPSSPPAFSWVEENSPDFQMQERTFVVFAFDVSDEDNAITDLTFDASFTKKFNTQNAVDFSFEVDIENKTLRIDAGRSLEESTVDYEGMFTVSDGINSQSLPFSLSITSSKPDTQLKFVRNFYVLQNSTKVLDFDIVADSPAEFEITDIRYKNSSDETDNRLEATFNLQQQTISITAKADSYINNGINDIIMVVDFNDNGQFDYSNELTVNIRQSLSENENALSNELQTLQRIIVQSREYEAIGDYINQYLLLKGFINSDEYYENRIKLRTFRERADAGARFTVTDITTKLSNTSTYANNENYTEALNFISQDKTDLSNQGLVNLSEFVNSLILLDSDNLFTQSLTPETLKNIEADYSSRFVGDSEYGSFNSNGIWEFSEPYRFLKTPILQLQNRTEITE